MEQTPARVDRRRDRAEMIVEFALGDRVEQRALGIPGARGGTGRWLLRRLRVRLPTKGMVAVRPDGPGPSTPGAAIAE